VTRKRHAHVHKKKSGVLTGLRGGVRRAAHAVVSEPSGSRRKKMVWNVLTTILLLAAVVFLARRFGWIHF
jgi:ferric-dicitrate binding protein FerR (iron transport regulator)